jgi:hypothetical protein
VGIGWALIDTPRATMQHRLPRSSQCWNPIAPAPTHYYLPPRYSQLPVHVANSSPRRRRQSNPRRVGPCQCRTSYTATPPRRIVPFPHPPSLPHRYGPSLGPPYLLLAPHHCCARSQKASHYPDPSLHGCTSSRSILTSALLVLYPDPPPVCDKEPYSSVPLPRSHILAT